MDRITTSSITKNLGIPFGRLREWIVNGYIKPSLPSPGQGRAAEFTIEDVYKIKAFQHMIDAGLTRDMAAKYIDTIIDISSKHKSKQIVQISEVDVIVFRRSDKIIWQMYTYGYDEKRRPSWGSNLLHALVFGVGAPKSTDPPYLSLENCLPARWDTEFGNTPQEWDDVYILNFRKIRESVDKVFGI